MAPANALPAIQQLYRHLQRQIIGQDTLLQVLILGVLCRGHVLLEGPPGIAKTRAAKSLAAGIRADFRRVQFTPDLLPGDITGSDILNLQTHGLEFRPGPVFTDLLLADELNRAPAKVQSALLEAMSERQVSAGGQTRPLSDLFMVIATQNPLEHEGTYPLPDAQLDRFLLQVQLRYPGMETEREILQLTRSTPEPDAPTTPPVTPEIISAGRAAAGRVHVSPAIETYIVRMADATRRPEAYDNELSGWLHQGVSPRASQALDLVARARAWLAGRDFVTPEDVQWVLPLVYRHRLVLDFQAMSRGVTPEQVVQRLLDIVAVS